MVLNPEALKPATEHEEKTCNIKPIMMFLFKFCALMFEILLGKLFPWYMARSALLCEGIERGTARGRKKSILKKCSGIVRISFFFSFLLFTYQMAYFQNPRTSFKSKITKRYSMGQSERH